jgi:serine/threonine-protein kinase
VREAQAAAKLDHPNICSIHEVGEEAGHSYIVMQYVEGETLSSRLKKKPLELSELLEVAVQIADALAEAHARGIIHRDIKPQNIMITPRGQAKVMDFGLAKLCADEALLTSEAQTKSLLTEQGTIVGTLPYMSPEQVRGDTVDPRSDVFSFGAVLYEMVTGTRPFAGPSTAKTISAIITEQPPPLTRYTDAPTELQRIVGKCLQKERERRYTSARDLLVDLRNFKRDSDPNVIAVTSATSKRPISRKWIYGPVALATLVLGVVAFYFLFRERSSENRAIHSLAILPFVNANADPNAEYLSDGITESLINSLSQLSQLKVIARTTAFRYKGKDIDPQVTGRELHVDGIITGKVTQLGDTLIIQADFLNAADGTQIWGQRYSSKLSDIFAVQEQIAREIGEKLRLTLTGQEKQGLSKRYTENIRAYQNYLLGRSLAQRRTREDLFSAINNYEKAIEEDGNYALAYAGLADAYTSLAARAYLPPDEGRSKAQEAAQKALSLDPNLAEAHASIGQTKHSFAPYDFPLADRELRRAIELSPSLAAAHQFLGTSLNEQGRFDEALEEHLKARELDPLSTPIARNVAFSYLLKRDYPRALELLRQSKDLGPPFVFAAEIEIYMQNGLLDEALAELEKAKRERKDDPLLITVGGIIYAAQGKRIDALQIIKESQESSGPSLSRAVGIARIYAAMNEKELALSWLERAFEARAISIFYKDAPLWDPIRGDPRFRDLLKRMNVPEPHPTS